jgi:hypothetical protein
MVRELRGLSKQKIFLLRKTRLLTLGYLRHGKPIGQEKGRSFWTVTGLMEGDAGVSGRTY